MYVIPTDNLLVVFLLKRTQFLKFNSSINISSFGYTRDERSTYINDLNCYWSTKSSRSRDALFTFLFVYSKQIPPLVLVGYRGVSCCFGEAVHPFTYSSIISTRIILLHSRISISSSSLLLPFISSFIKSTWLFLLHLSI